VREIAGQWFESASDGTRALHEEISPHEDVIEAAEVCPVKAIRVVNAADGTQVAP
jgi:ferredoxin